MLLLRKINHEEAKSTKVFLIFLRVLRFFVVDFHSEKQPATGRRHKQV